MAFHRIRFVSGAAAAILASSAAAQTIRLTPTQEKAIGLQTAPVAASVATPLARVAGVLQPPPQSRAVVSAPFAGVVSQVSVLEGQAVRAGAALAVIFSREAMTASSELRQAQAEASVAASAAARTRRLVEEGIVAGARREEADARDAAARAALQEHTVAVRGAGADGSGRYTLRAPFAGRIARVDVEVGQGLPAMAPAFVVDRQDRLLVRAALPASLAGRVRAGQRVAVEGVEGRVVAVGAAIDPRTRSLTVHAEIPARPNLVAGASVQMEIFAPSAGGLTAPRGAVTTLAGRTVVFARTPNGYVVTPVTVEGYTGDRAALRAALPAGAHVAITGLSELKARAGD